MNYKINQNFDIGLSFERGNFLSFKFIYKNNPLSSKPKTNFKAASTQNNDNSYTKLIKNLENNGIGVNKIIETSESIGIELTQFIHPNLNNVEEIIKAAKLEAGINKDIKKDLRIANLQAYSEYDSEYERNSKLIYERDTDRIFNTDTNFVFRPFLASREEFFKGAILIENNSELIFSQNFFFSSNLKYTIADNFDDLRYPAKDLYLEQVRSDVKDYLKNFDNGIIIGRAQFDYHISHKKNHHLMFSGAFLKKCSLVMALNICILNKIQIMHNWF